ncbi:hypothetical protein V8G54_035783 [Vigna mungo]|uniref:Uncharacterized protein n=1 Tax=Vigna mungo TaxID=3915 RepID=A0AAQ3MH93_VIGMU
MSGDAPSSDLPPSQGGMTFIRLPKKRVANCSTDHRLPISFNMQTYKPLGENNTKFIRYMTLLGRRRHPLFVIIETMFQRLAGSDRRCKRHDAGGTDKERFLTGFQWKGHMNESNIHRNE